MDVKALYTNISNNKVIAPVKRKHGNHPKKTVVTKVNTKLLALFVTLRYFIFNTKFYLHIKRWDMGTICVPTYTEIFMSELEERYIYLLIKNKSSRYLYFIDDVFILWTKSKNKIKTLGNEINKNSTQKNWLFRHFSL